MTLGLAAARLHEAQLEPEARSRPEAQPGPQAQQSTRPPVVGPEPQEGEAPQKTLPTRVRVMGPTGPLADARVAVIRPEHHGFSQVVAEGRSGIDGWVELASEPDATRLFIRAEKAFFVPVRADFTPGMQLTLQALGPARGKVTGADGLAVRGARIVAQGFEGDEVTSGPDGQFVLPVPERARVMAEFQGHFGVATGDWGSLEVKLLPPRTWVGKVVDVKHRPLANVGVEVSNSLLTVRTTTGSDGIWRAPYTDEFGTNVTFSAPGYDAPSNPLSQIGEVTTLFRPASLRGTVVDSEGRPVADAPVSLKDKFTTTNAVGAFAFAGLLATEETVTVSSGADLERAEKEVRLEAGENTTVLKRLPVLEDVVVHVVDATGKDHEHWTGIATPLPDEGWSVSFGSDEPLRAHAGRVRLAVRVGLKSGPYSEQEFVLQAHGPALRMLVVEPEHHLLEVVVRGATGVLIGGANVTCDGQSVESREDGTATCPVSLWGTGGLAVTAAKDELSASATISRKQSRVELTLSGRHQVTGQIVGLLPAKCTLTVNSGTQMDSQPLAGPNFVFSREAAPRSIVCVESNGTKLGCAIVRPNEVAVSIVVGAPGTVTMQLLDEHGAPLEEPVLYIDRYFHPSPAPGGLLSISLEPGEHVMVVNARGSTARAERTFTVTSGATVTLPAIQLE